MHVIVFVKATEESEKGITDTPEIQAMMEDMAALPMTTIPVNSSMCVLSLPVLHFLPTTN